MILIGVRQKLIFAVVPRIRHSIWLAVTALVFLYYGFLLTNGDFKFFAREELGLTFNAMALGLLNGDFSIPQDIIGNEAFVHDGKTFTYFGVFPALLRLPLIPFVDLHTTYLSRLSCLMAITLATLTQLRTLACCMGALAPSRQVHLLMATAMVTMVLSGPQVYLLGSAWVYHEPIFWAFSIACLFNHVVITRGAIARKVRLHDLRLLATFAGLALITRVSVAIGLYAATVGALLAANVQWFAYSAPVNPSRVRLTTSGIPDVVSILVAFAVVAGYVNWQRWGNPLTFADFRTYAMYGMTEFGHSMQSFLDYGTFNFRRVPAAIAYYFLGSTVLQDLLAQAASVTFDWVEGPQSSFFINAPTLLAAAALGIRQLFGRSSDNTGADNFLRAVLAGQFASIIFLLGAMVMTLRYRMDFSPFLNLVALIGIFRLCAAWDTYTSVFRRILLSAIIFGSGFAIIVSHRLLLQYKIWNYAVDPAFRSDLSHTFHWLLWPG